MQFPEKHRKLLILSVVVIVLAFAANDGTREPIRVPEKPLGLPYPYAPVDIDPKALDFNDKSVITAPRPVAPKPVVPPGASAEAYLVANLDTGEVYAERNSRAVFPIASLSKLVTALVAVHGMDQTKKVTITQTMLDAYGDAGHFVLGETFTVTELLAPLLLESSNDGAEALAESYGYNDFIQKMNTFTVGLGMTSTSFRDPSGLSSGNVSNTRDLLVLARYIYTNEKPLLELTRQLKVTVGSTTEHGPHTWNTINPFPLDPHFMGGKTGRTIEAKESMISLFRYVHGMTSYPVAIIVLRSDFSVRESDSAYLFEQFIQKIDKR